MGQVEIAAEKAKLLLNQIPLENKSLLNVVIRHSDGDPTMYYIYNCDGEFYQVISERGCAREALVAKTMEEMVDYFIKKAIESYAFKYEFNHRRHFENNLRQTHEVMEWCYSFIDGRKIVRQNYDDEIHIILDLLHAYKKACGEILALNYQPQGVAGLCNYIIGNGYADNPDGGMKDPKVGIKKAHDVMEEIQALLLHEIDIIPPFEQYYKEVLSSK